MKPYYEHAGITIYHADCRDILPQLEPVDLVLTDPPYPNNAGHFDDGVVAAREVLLTPLSDKWFVFWDEMESPLGYAAIVAKHIWHRTNTNRPDNYEMIYEMNIDIVLYILS